MKILGVVGSPRRNGNTHILVSKILEGAKGAGSSTDLLFLGDLKIQECDGCHACWRGTPCPKHDDMNAVYSKIIESDAIIFGTPVYWYGPTALMKAFIDRLVYFNCPENRAKIRGKLAAVAIPHEEASPHAADLLTAFFERCFQYLEMNYVGGVTVGGVTRRGDIKNKTDRLNAAHRFGRRVVNRRATRRARGRSMRAISEAR